MKTIKDVLKAYELFIKERDGVIPAVDFDEHYDGTAKALADLEAICREVIGEAPKPFINGKYPERGETVTVDLENNYVESIQFIQDNGAYTQWAETNARLKQLIGE